MEAETKGEELIVAAPFPPPPVESAPKEDTDVAEQWDQYLCRCLPPPGTQLRVLIDLPHFQWSPEEEDAWSVERQAEELRLSVGKVLEFATGYDEVHIAVVYPGKEWDNHIVDGFGPLAPPGGAVADRRSPPKPVPVKTSILRTTGSKDTDDTTITKVINELEVAQIMAFLNRDADTSHAVLFTGRPSFVLLAMDEHVVSKPVFLASQFACCLDFSESALKAFQSFRAFRP